MAILGNIPDSDYFSMKEISNSDLKLIERSYSHFLNKHDKEETSSMNFGKALHTLVLEETKFYEQFIIAPAEMDRRTKEGKATYAALLDSGREIITAAEWVELNQLKQNILAHPIAKNILIGAQAEGAITGEIEGVAMRAKIDLINKGYVIDLKTCQDASKGEFMRSIGKYSYYQQAAVYLELCKQNNLEASGFLFIAVERGAKSCGVACYSLNQESIDIGLSKAKRTLNKYKEYVNNPQKYVGYSDSIEVISAPNWSFYNELDS
jgi:exodeoxyribonuclease VIII